MPLVDQLEWVSAEEAIAALRIKPKTLYAYASRGLLRRCADPGSPRRSMYAHGDVMRLAARQRQADERGRAPVRGGPIVSAVTTMSASGPRYRGHAFTALARHPGRFENVAELLWTGMLLDEPLRWQSEPAPANLEATLISLRGDAPHLPMLRAFTAAALVLGESAARELRSARTIVQARRMVLTFAACLGLLDARRPRVLRPRDGEGVAELALRALGRDKPDAAAVIAVNAALIAGADEAMNAATTAARAAAGAGAGLSACVVAALGAHSGPRLGGAVDRLEDQLGTLPVASGAAPAPVSWPELADATPDARGELVAQALQGLSTTASSTSKASRARASRTRAPKPPEATLSPLNYEQSLVLLSRTLKLPRRAAGAIGTLARSAGWIAHIIEQRMTPERR